MIPIVRRAIDFARNKVTMTVAQLNTALVDADVATLTGTETLTNKTLTSPTISGVTGLAKADVGLANVDNTSDANKPVSTAQATAISTAVTNLIGGAPGALDTLDELAAALADDASFATTVTNSLALKAPLASPTFTGTVSGITKTMVSLGNVDNVKTDTTLPASVPSNRNRLHFYDPSRNCYNYKGSNTRRLRASLAKAANGGLRHWAMVGDSIMAGYMGTGASPVWEPTKAYPRIMRSYLAAQGIPIAGTGMVPTTSDVFTGPIDSRWTFNGVMGTNWLVGTNTGWIGTFFAGQTATFVSDTPGTQVDVVFFGDTGSATVNVDGLGAVALTMTAGTRKYTLSGLANAIHTVVVTTTSAALFALIGASVTNPTGSGLVIHNVSMAGSKSGDWTSTGAGTFYTTRLSQLPTPDVVFIELGGNDYLNSVSGATFKTNMATIISFFPNSDVVLVAIPSWSNMLEEMYDLADLLDVPLVDWFDRYGGTFPSGFGQSANNAYGNGLVTDSGNIHPNQAWHLDAGRNLGLLVAS